MEDLLNRRGNSSLAFKGAGDTSKGQNTLPDSLRMSNCTASVENVEIEVKVFLGAIREAAPQPHSQYGVCEHYLDAMEAVKIYMSLF